MFRNPHGIRHGLALAIRGWLFRKWWVAGWDRWQDRAWWQVVAGALVPRFYEDEL